MPATRKASQHDIVVCEHSTDDLDLLAQMNHRLIEDEGHRNPMTVPELKERFKRFVAEDGWSVDLLMSGDEVIGFATHRYEVDEAAEGGRSAQLRQFFIDRQHRGAGVGRAALKALIQARFKPGERIVLHVLENNLRGQAFWSRTGFVPYGRVMEMNVAADEAE
ncbi:MAG: GNAT family N-acetyltransferase [Pseudomonadota bacterium]